MNAATRARLTLAAFVCIVPLACNESAGGGATAAGTTAAGTGGAGGAPWSTAGAGGAAEASSTAAGAAGSSDASTNGSTAASTGAGSVEPLLFDMDYSSEESNWTLVEANETWDLTLLSSGGPSGQPAMKLEQFYTPTDVDGQAYWGHVGAGITPVPTLGSTRYVRFRLKYDETNNFMSGVPGEGHMTNKLLIVSQGCEGGNCRAILGMEGHLDQTYVYTLGTDGGESLIWTDPYSIGQWQDVQIELRYSTVHDAVDGGTAIWIDNDAYDSPTISNTRILNVGADDTANGNYSLGAFANTLPSEGGNHIWYHADFEIGETFDPAWHAAR